MFPAGEWGATRSLESHDRPFDPGEPAWWCSAPASSQPGSAGANICNRLQQDLGESLSLPSPFSPRVTGIPRSGRPRGSSPEGEGSSVKPPLSRGPLSPVGCNSLPMLLSIADHGEAGRERRAERPRGGRGWGASAYARPTKGAGRNDSPSPHGSRGGGRDGKPPGLVPNTPTVVS